MSSSPRTTPGSDRSMKSFVVFDPHRTMMWCQPRRISRSVRIVLAIALASSSAMPGFTSSAMRCTAMRVRVLTSISRSMEYLAPVPSRSDMMVMVVSSVLVDGRREQGVVAQVVGGVGRHHQHLGRVDLGAQPVGPVGVEVGGGARLEEVDFAVELEAEPAAHHRDPLLAAVAGRLGRHPVRTDGDPQGLER